MKCLVQLWVSLIYSYVLVVVKLKITAIYHSFEMFSSSVYALNPHEESAELNFSVVLSDFCLLFFYAVVYYITCLQSLIHLCTPCSHSKKAKFSVLRSKFFYVLVLIQLWLKITVPENSLVIPNSAVRLSTYRYWLQTAANETVERYCRDVLLCSFSWLLPGDLSCQLCVPHISHGR